MEASGILLLTAMGTPPILTVPCFGNSVIITSLSVLASASAKEAVKFCEVKLRPLSSLTVNAIGETTGRLSISIVSCCDCAGPVGSLPRIVIDTEAGAVKGGVPLSFDLKVQLHATFCSGVSATFTIVNHDGIDVAETDRTLSSTSFKSIK